MRACPERLCPLQHTFERTNALVDNDVAFTVHGEVLACPILDVERLQRRFGGLGICFRWRCLRSQSAGLAKGLGRAGALGGEFLLMPDFTHCVASDLRGVV